MWNEPKSNQLGFLKRGIVHYSVFVLLLIGFASCSNELDSTATWKETLVVYCLLDAKADTQFVRVSKAFLNEKTGALQIAQIADSLYPDTVIVTIKNLNTGKISRLSKFNAPKQPGIFNNSRHPLYIMVKQNGDSIAVRNNYAIEVINPKTGFRVWSETNIVEPAKISSPFRNSNAVFTFNFNLIVFNFYTGLNSAGSDGKFIVNYTEMSKIDTNQKVNKTIIWDLFTSQYVNPGKSIVIAQTQKSMFYFMQAKMGIDNSKLRRINSVGCALYTGNQQVMDYISINEPSLGIVQKQAEYTNINGGYGLFGSRCAQIIDHVRFESMSISTLQNDSITRLLNIVK